MLITTCTFETHLRHLLLLPVLASVLLFQTARAQSASSMDPSPHQVRSVAVAPDVRLEVLDWGGTGEPMIFLAGVGNTAHSYHDFAPRFRDAFRVYGITRRGFGASSRPESGYDSSTRARDILMVLDSLGIQRVVLVGHSISGDELSRFAVDHPERVRALVYLDAFSFGAGFDRFRDLPMPPDPEMTASDSASVQSVADYVAFVYGVRWPLAEVRATSVFGPTGRLEIFHSGNDSKVEAGVQRSEFARIRSPALAFWAVGGTVREFFAGFDEYDDENRRMAEAATAYLHQWRQEQRDRFRKEMRYGTMVEIVGAHHYIHYSHADDVEREVRNFLSRSESRRRAKEAKPE